MGTECQKDYCEEDKQLLDEAEEAARREQEQGLDEQLLTEYTKEMPAIEAANEDRAVELLQENVRNSQERLNEARTLSAEGSRGGKEEWERKLEELDHGKWPSDKESRDTYHAGRELGIRKWSCASLPPITGLGVKDIQPHIKETIAVLSQNEKLWQYRQLWSEPFANKILFADRDALRKEGIDVPEDVRAMTFRAQTLLKDKDLPSTIFVFSDSKGKFPQGEELLGHLTHEIAHGNEQFEEGELKNEGKDMGWFKPVVGNEMEWQAAVEAQIQKGFVSESSLAFFEKIKEKEHKSIDDLPYEPHFVHEHFAVWVMDSPALCDEMRQFFDKYMPKAFGE